MLRASSTVRTSICPISRGAERRLLYVPAELAEVVRHHVSLTEQIESTLAAISAINLELLARRQLD